MTVRPHLVTVGLDCIGTAFVFGLTGTGVASPEFPVGVAHRIGCCSGSLSRGCIFKCQ